MDIYGILEMCPCEMLDQTRPNAKRADKGAN